MLHDDKWLPLDKIYVTPDVYNDVEIKKMNMEK